MRSKRKLLLEHGCLGKRLKSLICFADPHNVPAALNRTQYMLVSIAVYLHNIYV